MTVRHARSRHLHRRRTPPALRPRPRRRRPPNGWSRRCCSCRPSACGVGGRRAAVGTLGQHLLGTDIPEAWAGAPIGPTDGILITLFLYGGNDGLNTVVPFTDSLYYSQRANIAIPAAQVLPINGTHGLNPNLTYLKKLWTRATWPSSTASATPTRIARTSTRWRSGWRASTGRPCRPRAGWAGGWTGSRPSRRTRWPATIDTSIPQHLVGDTAVPRRAAVGRAVRQRDVGAGPADVQRHAGDGGDVGGQAHGTTRFASTMKSTVDIAGQLSPVFNLSIDASELTKKMTMARG